MAQNNRQYSILLPKMTITRSDKGNERQHYCGLTCAGI